MMGKSKNHSVGYFDMQFVTSSISTMLVLLLLGMVVFFVLSANDLSKFMRENISITILISDDMKESNILRLQKELNSRPYVKETAYISKEQALKEQTDAMGTDPAEFLGHNPFTASIEMKLHADYANSDSIARIQKILKKNADVIEVNYPQEVMDMVNDNIKKISLVLLSLAGLLTLISFALINNTIWLAIYSKRFLIHTMKLVGASWGFIRKPFLVRNIWSGVLAGILADGFLMGGAYMLVKYEPELIEIITPGTMLTVCGTVFAFGIIITFLCAYFSINRYLRMKASTLYYV